MPSPSGSGRLRRLWGTWLDSGRGRSRRWSFDPPELAQLDLIHMHRVWNDSQRVLLLRSAGRCTAVMDITNRLDGKAALVTGGSRGIGAEIVRRLAAEGADVGFTYHTGKDGAEQVAAQVRGLGRRVLLWSWRNFLGSRPCRRTRRRTLQVLATLVGSEIGKWVPLLRAPGVGGE